MAFEAMQNSSGMAAGGAGVATAQAVVEKGVSAVLTGNCGPNAYQVLNAAGVEVITGVSGPVKEAIKGYRQGRFIPAPQANVTDHFGASPGGGRGGGMGRGMGRGTGAGMGFSSGPSPQMGSLEQGLAELKTQSQLLAKQLADVQRRLDELEKPGK
jgi:predicted Fe-Mo cluster-binding NifX family protein